MQNKKFNSYLEELMELIEQGNSLESNSFSILFSNGESMLMGINQTTLPLTNAVMLIHLNNELKIIGHLNHKKYDPNKKALIAFDGRKSNNNKLFIEMNEDKIYFDKKTNLNLNDKIYIFWQYGTDNCLITLGVNPITRKNSIDTFMHFCSENNSKLKIILYHILELTNSKKEGESNID